MVTLAKPKQLATGLWQVKTDYKMDTNAFPDNGAYHYVYSSPTNVRLMARIEGTGSAALDYVLQISSESTTLNPAPPYVGWDKPAGLLTQETFKKIPLSTVPEDPAQSNLNTVVMTKSGTPVVKLGPSAKYVYLNKVFPFFTLLGKTGTIFYVRVVPVLANKAQPTPAAPPSNWLPFYITVSKTEQEETKSKEEAAIAKAKAEQLAAIAKAKEEEKQKAFEEEQKQMRQALSDAYEVRLLSYIPPKFEDDADASDYFLANRTVTIPYYEGGDEKVTQLVPGETYSLKQVKNMIDSHKTWSQELWELAAATLNQASNAYQSAKNGAVDAMATGINTIGIDCNDKCKGALMTGLNATLAACGVPPTIPNIDQLYNKGIDYLTETIADAALEQVTGVPIGSLGVDADTTKALAKQARGPVNDGLYKLLYSIGHPAPFDPGAPETWGTPAPFYRHRPAMLYLEIRLKPGAQPPANQSWQGLAIGITGGEFDSIPQTLLPRTIENPVRIPIALSTLKDPTSWIVQGWVPEGNLGSNSGVGQPYYGDRPTIKIEPFTQHRLADGSVLVMFWPTIQISPGYVNAIPLPKGMYLDTRPKQEFDKYLKKNGGVETGPLYYYGKIRLSSF